MTDFKVSQRSFSIEHVTVVCDKPFEETRKAFEKLLPTFNVEALALLSHGEIERAGELLEKSPELSILLSRDHGSVLKIAGLNRKAIQYDVGNPLTASKMTRHRLQTALYAPFRVVLYENTEGQAIFEYDKPSTIFSQFDDREVTNVALSLDAAIEATLKKASTGSFM